VPRRYSEHRNKVEKLTFQFWFYLQNWTNCPRLSWACTVWLFVLGNLASREGSHVWSDRPEHIVWIHPPESDESSTLFYSETTLTSMTMTRLQES